LLSLDPIYRFEACGRDSCMSHPFQARAGRQEPGPLSAADANADRERTAEAAEAVERLVGQGDAQRRILLRQVSPAWSPRDRGLAAAELVAGRYRVGELIGRGGMG
jgi:hypothetical protein